MNQRTCHANSILPMYLSLDASVSISYGGMVVTAQEGKSSPVVLRMEDVL